MNNHRLNRLVQLNAIADRALEIRFSGYEDEDESNMGRNLVAGGAVGAAGYGAYKGRQGVINKYGVTDDFGNRVARRGMYGDAARGELARAKDFGGRVAAAPGVAVDAYKSARARGLGELKVSRSASAKQALKAVLAKLRGK